MGPRTYLDHHRRLISRRRSIFLVGLASLASLTLSCGERWPDERPLVITGHSDVVLAEVRAGREWRPLILGDAPSPRVCIRSEQGPLEGNERLELTLGWRGSAPQSRLLSRTERFACFEVQLPSNLDSDEVERLCGQLVRSDGGEERFGCREFVWRPRDEEHRRLSEWRDTILDRRGELDLTEQLAAFDSLSAEADAGGFALLAARARIISAQFAALEGGDDGVAQARQRLASVGELLESPSALRERADVLYQSASLDLTAGRLDVAWRQLQDSEELSRQVGALEDARTAVILQAQVLERLGAPARGASRLRTELARTVTSEKDFAHYARGQLAWLLLLDSQASRDDLSAARSALAEDLQREAFADDPVEEANQRINLAFLDQRLGQTSDALEQARSKLESLQGETEWREELLDWSFLIEGLGALEREDLEAAISACQGLAANSRPQISAWATSCLARANEQIGNHDDAAVLYQRAQLLSRLGDADIGRGLGLGISQASLDYFRHARLEVTRGDPDAAWQILERLDLLSSQESERRKCREAAEPGSQEDGRWIEIAARTDYLLELLKGFDGPASTRWRQEQEEVTGRIRQQLRDLAGEWPGCRSDRSSDVASGVDYRAFWVDAEVLVLSSRVEGDDRRVSLERRTNFSHDQLTSLERQLEVWLEHGGEGPEAPDSETWSRALEPIARSLVPADLADLPSVSIWALHGRLQQIPLAALPVAGGWLSDLTVVARRPSLSSEGATLGAANESESVSPSLPLFVVDPQRNLRGAQKLARRWAQELNGRLLSGDDATVGSFQGALSAAAWLHIGAHIDYDQDFPELSRLRLADGDLLWLELFDRKLDFEFANLSACDSGRWPATADSGSYGLAGLMARKGTGWVLASRSPLSNRAAVDFNSVFYEQLASGVDLPTAYARAHQSLRDEYPPPVWATILLIEGRSIGVETVAAAGIE